MRHIRVEDVILQTVATLVNLAARRLGLATAPGEDPSEERDIEQARLAIEAVRALVPLCPEEQMAPVKPGPDPAADGIRPRDAGGRRGSLHARCGSPGAPPDAGDRRPGGAGPSPEDDERAKARVEDVDAAGR